jgi:hopene-associated glycosyltransferase HpnB
VLSLTLTLSAVSLFIWVVLTFFRGAFWRLGAFDDDVASHSNPGSWPPVVAIVPARNEAETIARTVASLAAQNYAGELRIIVADDNSEDSTADVVKQTSERSGLPERITVVRAETLPLGWTGKIWAMQQGIRKGAEFSADYFWFTDADIVHAPDTLQRLISRAEGQRLELVSLMVLLRAKSFAECLLIPAFLYFFLKLYVPKWIANSSAKTAGAAGGCVLLRRTALERIGGFSAIRAEVIDDCALARAVKHSGGRIWMGLTRKSVSLRAYETFGEIRNMIARTAFTQLGYSSLLLLGTLLGMFLTYIVPVVLAFSRRPAVWRMSLAAWVLMTLTYLPAVRYYRLSPLWAPFLPAAAAFYSCATWLSAVRFWMGQGGQWKGRAQAPANQ